MAALAVFGLVILGPLLALIGAFGRALMLFWPTMLLLGAVHSYLPVVPALGWSATFFVVALISVLIPTGGSTNTTTK